MTNSAIWNSLGRLAAECEPYDRQLDAEIYAAKVVEDSEITYDARPSSKPGTVICYYDSQGRQTHGTCSAPDYTRNIREAASLMPGGWLIRVTQARFGAWVCEGWRGDKSVHAAVDAYALGLSEETARTACACHARAVEAALRS